jgi:hypothetical protein
MSRDYPNRQDWIYLRETRKQGRRGRILHNSDSGTFRNPTGDFPLVRLGLSRRVGNRPGPIMVAAGESRPKNPEPPGYLADGTRKSASYFARIRHVHEEFECV